MCCRLVGWYCSYWAGHVTVSWPIDIHCGASTQSWYFVVKFWHFPPAGWLIMQLLGRNCDTTPLPCIGRKERRSLGRKWEKGTLQKYNNFACYLKVILQPRFYLYRGWRPFCYPNSAFFHPFLFPVISETQTIGAKIRQGFFYWQSSFAPSFHLTHICKI